MFAFIVFALEVLGCITLCMMVVPYVTRSRSARLQAPVTFLAHWVETYTVLLKFKRWQHMHRDPHDVELSKLQLFLCGFYSLCSLVSPLSHEVVNVFDFSGKQVGTVLVNVFAWHFAIPKWLGGTTVWPLYIRWKMKRATVAAHAMGVRLQGLGAATKDHQLTDDGMWYTKVLGDNRPKLVHGDTLTAVTVYHQVMMLLKYTESNRIFLTGATSKIGRALAVRLARAGITVCMYTVGKGSKERFNEIVREAGEAGRFLQHSINFSDLSTCRLCVTGKSKDKKELLANARLGTVFLNFAVPDPFTPADLEGMPFYHYDGALLDYSEISNTLVFAMRLKQGQYTYACHAWLLTAAKLGITVDELGPVNVDEMDMFWEAARSVGFKLPELTSFLYPVEEPPKMEDKDYRHTTPRPAVRPRKAA